MFEVAEALAIRLRSRARPHRARFLGYVDGLRGQPTENDPRPSGEVDFTLFDDEQGEVPARGVLNADDYALAGAAHLASDVVAFKAILRRVPGISRVEGITDFERVVFARESQEVPEGTTT
jgi:hypothetical protein